MNIVKNFDGSIASISIDPDDNMRDIAAYTHLSVDELIRLTENTIADVEQEYR